MFRRMITGRAFLIAVMVLSFSGCAAPGRPAIGDRPPALTLEKVLQASDEAQADWPGLKGKVVVLEFWATWCAPCLMAIDHLNELADGLQGKPVQFIAITDEEESVIREFLKRRRIAGWVGLDQDRSVFEAYQVGPIPATVLVDRRGRVRAVTYPSAVDAKVLEDLLADRAVDLPRYAGFEEAAGPDEREVAAAKPAIVQAAIRESGRSQSGSASIGPGFLSARGWTVADAIAHAFDTRSTRIVGDNSGAPIEGKVPVLEKKLDIDVEVPPGEEALIRLLLQEALKAVCAYRIDRREVDVYVLQAPPEGPSERLRPALPGGGSSVQTGIGQFDCINCELRTFAAQIEHNLGVPVLDETNLSGRFDWSVKFDTQRPESLLEAVREQLGLELTAAKRHIDVCVVHALKAPPE